MSNSPRVIMRELSPYHRVKVLAASAASSVRPAILLVEDDFSLLDMLSRTLERAGFDVITAMHGVTALTLFGEIPIDLVVTDIVLPQMDGFELIRRLKNDSPHVPIIAISGMGDSPQFRDTAMKCGANETLTKPISRQQLVDLAKSMVGSAAKKAAAP
jgi:DNA-binding response OmpR family regulator